MLASLILLAAASGPLQDLAELDRRIADFTGAAVGEDGGAIQPIDRRLRLHACDSIAEMDWRTAERTTLVVRCPDAGGWRLYVPVRAARAAAPAVAARPIAIQRGDAVAIAVEGRGFSVSRPGEAMEEGAVGDWIKVRPVTGKSRRAEVMRARIVRPGVVALPAG